MEDVDLDCSYDFFFLSSPFFLFLFLHWRAHVSQSWFSPFCTSDCPTFYSICPAIFFFLPSSGDKGGFSTPRLREKRGLSFLGLLEKNKRLLLLFGRKRPNKKSASFEESPPWPLFFVTCTLVCLSFPQHLMSFSSASRSSAQRLASHDVCTIRCRMTVPLLGGVVIWSGF